MKQRVPARKPEGSSTQAQRASGRLGNALSGYDVRSAVQDVVNSPGIPLSAEARCFFEPRFGFDFSRVRIHADADAAVAARAMDAAAYTVGQHIAFDAGNYEPHSRRGLQLIGHELAHTVQQNGATESGELRIASPSDASEKEADRASSSALARERVAIRSHSPLSIQRQLNQSAPTALPELDPAANSSPMVAAAIGSMTVDQFVTGKSDIPASHKAELARTAKYIGSLLKQYPGSRVRVVGNTDAVGKDEDNQSLGQSRANSVQRALVDLGVPAEAIQTESRGASNLLVKTKAGNGRNRRVEVHFEPARQFPGLMTSQLTLPGTGAGLAGGGEVAPNLLPSHICTVSPEICSGDRARPPYRPPNQSPDAFKAVPSDIPWELMDTACISDAYTSHGNRSGMDDAVRASWRQLYTQYRAKLPKDLAAKAANSQICRMAGQDQSRDNPNPQDRFNQEWKNQNPNDKGIPPISPPFKPFKWEF